MSEKPKKIERSAFLDFFGHFFLVLFYDCRNSFPHEKGKQPYSNEQCSE